MFKLLKDCASFISSAHDDWHQRLADYVGSISEIRLNGLESWSLTSSILRLRTSVLKAIQLHLEKSGLILTIFFLSN
jgi:hypothetical protein